MLKKLLLTFVLIVVIGLIGYWGFKRSVPNAGGLQPVITVTPLEYDFGTINYGQTVEQVFTILNNGQKELKVSSVSTSCGCTKATISDQTIAAGEKADLQVTYKTADMTGAHAKGDQERRIFIKSNDPQSPMMIVQIKAYVK